jgi:hypothetical protein
MVSRTRRFGEVIVAMGVYQAETDRSLGQPLSSMPFVSVIRVRDDKLVTLHSYPRFDQAARAEGLPVNEPAE